MRNLFLICGGVLLLLQGCVNRPSSTKAVTEYSEDVSAYRPEIEAPENEDTPTALTEEKGPYVPPTHEKNREMSAVMDSIVAHNKEKTYITYVIQVYFGRSREEANQVREKIYRTMPDVKPQLSYRQPAYRVTVGRFSDRIDAFQTFEKLKELFDGATLVPERNYLE